MNLKAIDITQDAPKPVTVETRGSLADRLRALKVTQSTSCFAKKCGVSQPLMHMYLNDKRVPGADSIISICRACGCTSDWLLGLSDERGSIRVSKTFYDVLNRCDPKEVITMTMEHGTADVRGYRESLNLPPTEEAKITHPARINGICKISNQTGYSRYHIQKCVKGERKPSHQLANELRRYGVL